MDPLLLILLLILAALVAGTFALRSRVRTQRRQTVSVLAAHPGEVAVPARLFVASGTTAGQRGRTLVLLADRGGLSFRDGADEEVVGIAADRIMSVEFAPLNFRSAVRPARVALLDGAPVDFFLGVPADAQAEAVVAIRTALGRSAG